MADGLEYDDIRSIFQDREGIMWFGSRLFGFERGDTGAAVVSLVVSLAAAIAITAWARRRRR